MKQIFLIYFFLFTLVASCYSATITWIGPATGNWNNTSNWSSGTVPGIADDVLLNTNTTIDMDIIPASTPFIYAINSLTVTGNASVVLSRIQSGGGTRILQLKNSLPGMDGLRIGSGSTLTMNAANSTGALDFELDVAGAAGVVATIYGSLFFTGTGAGAASAHLRVYTSTMFYAVCTVKSGGLVKYFSNSGNTIAATGNYFVMESGADYEINKNGGSVPNGNWDDNSTIHVTGATTNGSLTFSQLRYGNLEWNAVTMGAVTQMIAALSPVTAVSFHNLHIVNTNGRELRLKTGAASASPPFDYTVRNKLDIAAGGILCITGINVVNPGAGARLHVMGDISNAGTLRTDGLAGTVNELELNGTTTQYFANSGILTGSQLSFIMNNHSGAELLTSLTLPGQGNTALQLKSGKILTTLTNQLGMTGNGGWTGGSTQSFIEGPMQKTGNTQFSFPIGKGSIYAPVSFIPAGPVAASDVYIAEYFRLNPQSAFGTVYTDPSLNHISYVEYWRMEKIAGDQSTTSTVTLTVTPESFAKDINTLKVIAYDNANHQWTSSAAGGTSAGPPSPPYITGTITGGPVSQSAVFTIGSTVSEAINPLPVRISSFTLNRLPDQINRLEWTFQDDHRISYTFDLQRSLNDSIFRTIAHIESVIVENKFMFDDRPPYGPQIRYRLRLTSQEVIISYSQVLSANGTAINSVQIKLFPNPVKSNASLTVINTHRETLNVDIRTMTGTLIRNWREQAFIGTSNFTIQTDKLLPGIYILSVKSLTMNGVVRFVKM